MRAKLGILLIFVIVVSALAGEETEVWAPTAPTVVGELDFDWVRLTNGEWLKGEFITMRNDDLVFDSDEFGEQTLDLNDIQELYTMAPVTIVYKNNDTAISRVSVVGDTVFLLDTNNEASKSAILSIIRAEATWWGQWEGKLALSLGSQYGNTNQTDLQLRTDIVNRGIFNRLTLAYIGSISLVERDLSANDHRVNGFWDLFISERFYLTPLSYEFYTNKFQNIQQQHTPAMGLGFELFNGDIFSMDINGGGGYQMTGFDSVPAGQDKYSHAGIVILGTVMSLEPTGDIEFKLNYTFQLDVANWPSNINTTVGEFSIDLTGSLDFNVGVVWDYRNMPQIREDGSTPAKHDVNVTAGIGFEF